MASAASNSWRGGNKANSNGGERGGGERGRGRGRGRGGGDIIKRDISNMSWKRPNEEESSSSILPNFNGAPSSFGTPSFIGGSQSNDPFGGDPASFGTPSFIGGGGRSNGGNALERASDLDSMFTPIATSTPTPSNQISTLEVLGEDSDSRKKRFESTLANNRYLEVSLNLLFYLLFYFFFYLMLTNLLSFTS